MVCRPQRTYRLYITHVPKARRTTLSCTCAVYSADLMLHRFTGTGVLRLLLPPLSSNSTRPVGFSDVTCHHGSRSVSRAHSQNYAADYLSSITSAAPVVKPAASLPADYLSSMASAAPAVQPAASLPADYLSSMASAAPAVKPAASLPADFLSSMASATVVPFSLAPAPAPPPV